MILHSRFFTLHSSFFTHFMQLCTKNVVITRVINDPVNFKILPI